MVEATRHAAREGAGDANAPVFPPAAASTSEAMLAGLRPVALLPVGCVAGVLAALAVVLMNSGTLNLEAFLRVQAATVGLPDTLWSLVTVCGTGVVAFALLSPTLAWQPRWYAAGLAAAAFAGLYSNGLKRLFALPRPASVLESGHVHVIGATLHANTFPSGHSVTAFTLASLLVLASRRPLATAAWAVPAAVLVAASRIAVGAHWPADLAAGAAGGWICGALGVIVVRRWRAWNAPGVVRAMGIVSMGVGVSLFLVQLGYPLALPLQHAAAVIAIVSGAVVIARPRVDRQLPGPAILSPQPGRP